MSSHVPLIDLKQCGLLVEKESAVSDEASDHVGKQLYSALSTSGFAYLSNHGITKAQIDGVNEVASNFYALPIEEKKKSYDADWNISLYDPFASTKFDDKHVDLHEGFRIHGESWSSENAPWPDVPMFKERCVGFAEICKNLMFRVLKALGVAMKLKDKDYFCEAHSLMNGKGNMTELKLINYPPVLSEDMLPETKMRLGEHTDWTTLIFLFQDNNGGLQMKTKSGEFVDVTPIPDTIVLNVGDTMQAWSGGRLKATVHRVVPPGDMERRKNVRRSIVYFGEANNDVLLETLQFEDGVSSEPQISQENTMTVEQYLLKRASTSFY